jgi:DNA-binding CsgD family transcriptional regulator
MQSFDRQDESNLAELPLALQLIITTSWGLHSRHLDARAMRLMSPLPKLEVALRKYAAALTPRELDRSKWSAEMQRRFELLRKLRRSAFGKHANADAHLLMEPIPIDQPGYVGGIRGEIDRWIADYLGISASTFRGWRRNAQDFKLEKEKKSPPHRRSGQDLLTRMAHGSRAGAAPRRGA